MTWSARHVAVAAAALVSAGIIGGVTSIALLSSGNPQPQERPVQHVADESSATPPASPAESPAPVTSTAPAAPTTAAAVKTTAPAAAATTQAADPTEEATGAPLPTGAIPLPETRQQCYDEQGLSIPCP